MEKNYFFPIYSTKRPSLYSGIGGGMWGREPTPPSPRPREGIREGVRVVAYTPSPRPREKIGGEGKVGSPHLLRRDAGRGLEEGECQSQGVNL